MGGAPAAAAASAPSAIRLYVGGLPPDIQEKDVIGRFTSFGAVSSCELSQPKNVDPAAPPPTCRGFAYVEMIPKDETSLGRCLSLVSGVQQADSMLWHLALRHCIGCYQRGSFSSGVSCIRASCQHTVAVQNRFTHRLANTLIQGTYAASLA